MRIHHRKIGIRKWAVIIAVTVLVLYAITACGSAGNGGTEETVQVSIDDVIKQVKSVNPVADERVIDDFALEHEMGLDPENIAEYRGVITNSQNDCALIFVAKAKEGKVREVKSELTEYLDGLAANDLYVEFADKIEKTKQARVLVFDDYAVLVIPGLDVENAEVVKAVNSAFEG